MDINKNKNYLTEEYGYVEMYRKMDDGLISIVNSRYPNQ